MNSSTQRPHVHFAENVLNAVKQKKMHGLDEVIKICLVALYTNGHVLLEGNPGLGKTELVKTLGSVLKLRFGRIQFTPDLMPADITGTFMPDFSGSDIQRLAFQPGPVFTSLLLADEINRATPKTQSAMLEAMAEKQVTVLGKKYLLPDGEEAIQHYEEKNRYDQKRKPFMVLATQNPIDHEGTYDLPEAQADRFMFKVKMPTPANKVLYSIMEKEAGRLSSNNHHEQTPPVDDSALPKDETDSRNEYHRLQEAITDVRPIPALEAHILNMVQASHKRYNELQGLDRVRKEELQQITEKLITYGLGPRTAIALLRGAKAWALLFPSGDVEEADGEALAQIALPVLRHRLKLHFDWQTIYGERSSKLSPSDQHDRLLADFCLFASPTDRHYRTTVEIAFKEKGLL